MHLACVPLDQHDGAAGNLVPAFENIEDGVQRRFEVQDAGKRLADLEQRGKPPGLVGVISDLGDSCVGHERIILQDCRKFLQPLNADR